MGEIGVVSLILVKGLAWTLGELELQLVSLGSVLEEGPEGQNGNWICSF